MSHGRDRKPHFGTACAVLVVAIALLAPLAGCGRGGPKVITLAGDSIVAGRVQVTRKDSFMGGGRSFADIVAKELEPSHRVINVGLGGTSTRDWSPSDWRSGGLPQKPLFDGIPDSDIVVVLLGTNDAAGYNEPDGAGVPPAEFEERLVEIVESLLQQGVDDVVLLVSAVPPFWRGTEPGRLLAKYSRRMAAICRRSGSTCVDLSVGMPETGYVKAIHPTETGHAFIAERLLATLDDLL